MVVKSSEARRANWIRATLWWLANWIRDENVELRPNIMRESIFTGDYIDIMKDSSWYPDD